ncbi:MAG: hypothetical protein ACR2QS_02335 [Woeseiaceae bacterium]
MNISNVRGLRRGVPAQSQDAVVAATPNAARQESFRAKLAKADNRLSRSADDRMAHSPKRTRNEQHTEKTGTTNGKNAVGKPLASNRNIDVRDAKPAQAYRSISGNRRLRKLQKSLPKRLRSKLSQLVSDQGLTMVDAWQDNEENSVTLIVDQEGHSRTKFVVEYEDTTWNVEVRSTAESDTEILLAARDALEERFNTADLGPVTLAKCPFLDCQG